MLEKNPRDRLSALPTMWEHNYFDGMYVLHLRLSCVVVLILYSDWNLVKERAIPPPWVPTAQYQHICLDSVEPLIPGLPYTPSSDPNPEFLYTVENLSVAAARVDDIPSSDPKTEVPKPLVPPTRAQLIKERVLKKLQQSTMLFKSPPAQISPVAAVQPLNSSHAAPTSAQRIILHVLDKLQTSTLLFNSHHQTSSLFVMVRPPNPSPSPHSTDPSTDECDGVSSPTRARSIIRHVLGELAKRRSITIPSLSLHRLSALSLSEPVNPSSASGSSARTLPSPGLLPAQKLVCPSVHAPKPGVGALERVKGWFTRVRYSPNHITAGRRRGNFMEDE
jgi:hypothetical protein